MMPQTIHDPWADPWADVDESAFEDAIVGATDLLQAVAGRDFPEGVVVIGRRLAPGIQGLSVGTGHRIAAANGDTTGRRGVLVDPFQATKRYGGVGIELVALHELAHSLLANVDATDDIAAVAHTLDPSKMYKAIDAARLHGPEWAAAYVVYTRRAIALRPWADTTIEGTLNYDLEQFGFPTAAEVLEALGWPVADDEPLRPILCTQSARMMDLFLPLPLEHHRAVVMATTGRYQV